MKFDIIPADENKPIESMEVDGSVSVELKALQGAVGGHIQVVTVTIDGEARQLIVDEEGLLKGKDINGRINSLIEDQGLSIVGDAVLITEGELQ
jgi:hypothetical protein